MHNRILIVAGVMALAVSANAPAWAGWGCHATGTNNAIGAAWGKPTEAWSRKVAVENCSAFGKNCRAECRENIDTQEQFEAIWPRPASIKNCKGDAKGC